MTATTAPIDRSTTTAEIVPPAARRLRAVLGANAATSALFGLAAAFATDPLADRLGVTEPAALRAVGIGLLVFAAAVTLVATGPVARLEGGALAVTAGDVAWVVATPIVLALAGLSTTGVVVGIVVAVGVADFAIAQTWLRRRL